MLRFEISEQDHGALPPIDVDDDVVVIGSSTAARIRLPAEVARAAHVQLSRQTWTLLAESKLGGLVRAAGDSGAIGHGIHLELGKYRVRVTAAPASAVATPPARTESLARELVRNLLGDGAAPILEIERGTSAGTTRVLPPPEATLVIGRGDEATWVILDEDLSRAHAEIRRGWDGVTVVDLGSKNGTRIDGVAVGDTPVELHDGATLTLGAVVMRFHDAAERHLRGETLEPKPVAARASPVVGAPRPVVRATRPSPWSFVAFAAIAGLAVVALIWILAT